MKPKNRIRVILAEQDLRSTYLVENLGVTKTTVSRWLNNLQQPNLNRLYEMAELLKVDVCDLLVRNKPCEESEG
jgi:transcriptional regulator with XRE-family HTH domain